MMERKRSFTSSNKVFVKRVKYKAGYFNVARDESNKIIGKQKWSRRDNIKSFKKDFNGYELNFFPKTKNHALMYERNYPESANKYLNKKQNVQVLASIKVNYRNKIHTFARASKRRSNSYFDIKHSIEEAVGRANGLAVDKLDIPYREVKKRTVKRSYTYRTISLTGKKIPTRTKTIDPPSNVRV